MRVKVVAMLQTVLGVAAVVLLGGCASASFNVTAMRFDVEPPRQRMFQIASPHVSGADAVEAPELAGYVQTALLNRGFRAAPAGQPADMVIEVVFEREPPRAETRTGSEKIYQWQPERIVLTTKQTKTSTGLVMTERVPKRLPAKNEAVGSRQVNYLVTVHPKRLQIVGRAAADATTGEPGRSLWSVEVRDETEAHDIEQRAVLMIAAAMDHLGDDFSGERVVDVSPGDERARLIRRGTAALEQHKDARAERGSYAARDGTS